MSYFLASLKEDLNSDLILIGFPFDSTTTYKPGSRFAPNSIREASISIETYSPYQKISLEDFKFSDLGDIELPIGDTQMTLEVIYETIKKYSNKFIYSLGGEHLITFPILKALREKYKNEKIILLDFDAHTDLRDNYLGVKFSHSTVIKRILELGNIDLIGIGIRAGTKEEFEEIEKMNSIFKIDQVEIINRKLANHLFYITIDIDAFDPSIVPAVSNPEPNGINFIEFINLISNLSFKNLIGIDLVEVNPILEISNRSSIFASIIVRETILKIFKDKFRRI
jgi:agmatinase